MNCCFFGHKDLFTNEQEKIKNAIIQLIENDGVTHFYVGNNGNFDYQVQKVLAELSQMYSNLIYYIVLSRIDEKALSGNQSATLFPEGLEYSLPKYAIAHRNLWMIKHASCVIAYTTHKFSNSYKWVEKAEKRGLKIIYLA